jgi:hypothetical protein
MKKKICLVALLILCGNVTASNIGLDIWQIKPVYYDNETVELNINVTNYDLTALSDAKLKLEGSGKDTTIKLDEILGGENIEKTLSIGKFAPGNYQMKAYIENTYLGVVDRSDEQEIKLRVELGKPVKMIDLYAKIMEVKVPKEVEINQETEIQIKIEAGVEGKLLLTLDDKQTKEYMFEVGETTVTQKYTFDTPGQHTLDTKTYSDKKLMDQKTTQITAIDKGIYKKVEVGDLKQKEGKIEVDGVENQDRSIIQDISCFLIGGCSSDFVPPKFGNVITSTQGDKFYFTVIVEDESRIKITTTTPY